MFETLAEAIEEVARLPLDELTATDVIADLLGPHASDVAAFTAGIIQALAAPTTDDTRTAAQRRHDARVHPCDSP